jgi:hypothetical protein
LKPGSARIDSASALFVTTAEERWGQTLRRAGAFDAQHLQDALPVSTDQSLTDARCTACD